MTEQSSKEKTPKGKLCYIDIQKIQPKPDQPRMYFSNYYMKRHEQSLEDQRVLQPIRVRIDPDKEGYCIVVAGEGRLRAAKAAGINTI